MAGWQSQAEIPRRLVPRLYGAQWLASYKAVIDLIESRFRFIVNPDLDSLANLMV